MTVYVDDVRHSFGRMVMCHMWADSLEELLEMARRINIDEKWLQKPPEASWVHFDISISKKIKALRYGAVLTDKFGPSEHVANLRWDGKMLDTIKEARKRVQNDRS